MKIAVLGTGEVGQTLAGAFAGGGHDVVIGTRDPEATRARTEPGRGGRPPISAWLAEHPAVSLATYADAAAAAEVVVNASPGDASVEVVTQAGADNLAGKVLIDVTNALDFSAGFPPTLFVKDAVPCPSQAGFAQRSRRRLSLASAQPGRRRYRPAVDQHRPF